MVAGALPQLPSCLRRLGLYCDLTMCTIWSYLVHFETCYCGEVIAREVERLKQEQRHFLPGGGPGSLRNPIRYCVMSFAHGMTTETTLQVAMDSNPRSCSHRCRHEPGNVFIMPLQQVHTCKETLHNCPITNTYLASYTCTVGTNWAKVGTNWCNFIAIYVAIASYHVHLLI